MMKGALAIWLGVNTYLDLAAYYTATACESIKHHLLRAIQQMTHGSFSSWCQGSHDIVTWQIDTSLLSDKHHLLF